MASGNYSRQTSFVICITAYVAALVCAGVCILLTTAYFHSLVEALLADVIATIIIFAFSVAFKNASLYDPYWSAIPPFIAGYWYSVYPSPAALAMLAVISFWALRLTANWARGWQGLGHQDWRYIMLREKNPLLYPLTNFAGIHMFPTVMVFLGMLPVYYLYRQAAIPFSLHAPCKILFYTGLLISVIATLIEWTADEQMRSFKKNAIRGAFINQGLWKYSRHPNYFGEILFWLGLWVSLMGIAPQYWYTAIGFAAMAAMFVFASIPMMERKNKAGKPGYSSYIQSVSMLIPWRPRNKPL